MSHLRRWRVCAAVIGDRDGSLRALLQDVLVELGVDLELVDAAEGPADLIFAVVTPKDAFRVLTSARALAGRSPIIAVLPLGDERLSRRALLGGARACWALDGPLHNLRAAFLEAISSSAASEAKASLKS